MGVWIQTKRCLEYEKHVLFTRPSGHIDIYVLLPSIGRSLHEKTSPLGPGSKGQEFGCQRPTRDVDSDREEAKQRQ